MNLPPPFNFLWDLWKKFSHILGLIMSWIILTILWIVAFGLYGIVLKIARLFTPHKKYDSYWIDTSPDFSNSMKYQF